MEPTQVPALERHNSRSIVSQALLSATAGAVLVMAALLAAPARAQQAPSASSSSSTELQEVVVTGSLIRRSDTELPSPVQILSSEDITNSGYSSITDILRNLPSNGQGALSQSFGQAFGAGGSGVALRGLTVGATLTLIDNERMVAYPLNDDNQRSFVDVSAIPIDAIDTVEVLKDNASAIYGSDAIAGVVNLIDKKNVSIVGGANTTDGNGNTQFYFNYGHDAPPPPASGYYGADSAGLGDQQQGAQADVPLPLEPPMEVMTAQACVVYALA